MENIDNIIDKVIEPMSEKKFGSLDNQYFETLTKIKVLCPDFDDRNIKGAQLFFEEVRK
jgi:hypothetical protein